MTPCRICLVTADSATWLPLLEGRLPASVILVDSPAEAEILIGRPVELAAVLDQSPNLRWAQSTFAGVDALMKAGQRRDYRLSRVTGIFGPAMAEWAFAQIISRERGFSSLASAQAGKRWEPRPYRLLSTLHLGLAGLGEIGAHLAATARHFGMRVSGYSRSGQGPEGIPCFGAEDFDAFLAEPDYFLFTLPDTPSTRGLINSLSLARMKPGAVLINAGRGSLIDEEALSTALQSGHLGGAILDVFAREPLSPDSPLWQAPGCIVSPHCSALSYPWQVAELFLANLDAYLKGEKLRGEVDFAKGY
ncbi:MAG: hypothetical protein RL095_2244 [Verrucomicrobiota bacterium]|jgi:phosphoglycerate dehydrogenase-like enzyme